jgi:hypothetical protein
MLTDRSETNRAYADQEKVTGPGWQDRAHPWAHTWSRRAVDSRITVSRSHAASLSIAGQPCGGTPELRWKGFFLRASRWKERPVGHGGLN